ncbi:MAG: response regulator, partial [Candidatus Hydrogenedentes bacterium]|nr:response regulator [Candidatus Hydrogenedentota bacterium]
MNSPATRILMVDDDHEEYIVVEKYLRKASTASYSVEWVSSFEEALTTVAAAEFDACLLDFQLGEHTGIEVLVELRKRGFHLPVILLTGHGNVEVDIQAMQLGAFDYLEKNNLTAPLLERSIRYAIENYRVRDALRRTNEELERRVQERTAELHRSNVELEQFVEIVARDLQQPMAAVSRYISNLPAPQPEQGVEKVIESITTSLESIFLAIRNTELLVQIVLDYSRTQGQRKPFDDVELAEAVDEGKFELQGRLTSADAIVTKGELPQVKGDRRLLAGVFLNLLDNALKFRGSEAPRIHVDATRKGSLWLCSVKDNGAGIPEEDADEVFLMFARGSRSGNIPGVGIGLALCRKIIEHHGGRIWVDS